MWALLRFSHKALLRFSPKALLRFRLNPQGYYLMSYALKLGYADTVELDLSPEAALQAEAIASRLVTIDGQLETAIADSFAVKLDGLQLDYGTHIMQLKQEGSRLLGALAQVTGLRVLYDSYTGQSRSVRPVSVLA